jgi:hypothetical protein
VGGAMEGVGKNVTNHDFSKKVCHYTIYQCEVPRNAAEGPHANAGSAKVAKKGVKANSHDSHAFF